MTLRHSVAAVCVFVLSVIAACERRSESPPAATPAAAKQPTPPRTPVMTICLLPKKKGVPYFTSCAKGAEEAAKELGVDLVYDGPTDGSPEKAASMIERWTLQGVAAICVSPNDPSVLAPAMKKARDKGIHVLTWDADGAPDSREFMVNQATAEEIGRALVDTMARDLGAVPGGDSPTGDVAIVTATLTAANQNEWMTFMRDRLRSYPGLKLVEIKPSNEDQRLAFQVTRDLMNAYPDLRGIWGISSVAFPAAAEAVKQSGKSGKVLVTGLSTPNDMKSFVHDGTVKSVILWNTMDLGYLTIHAAHAVVKGELKPGSTSLKAGRLGEKKVEGDKVMLGDILVFTQDNIDQFDF